MAKARTNNALTVAQINAGDTGGVIDPHDPAIEGETRTLVAQHADELNAGGLGPAGGDAVVGEDSDATDSLMRVLTELGDDAGQARVIVSRAAKDPREKPAYICSWYASEFSLDQLSAGYGGGVYLYRVVTPTNQIITRGKVSIEEPKNAAVLRTVAHVDTPPAGGGAADIAAAILAALKPIIDRPQKSTADVMQELKLYKEIFSPSVVAPVEPVPQKSVVVQLKEAMELQTLLSGFAGGADRGGGDSFSPIMVKLIEQFGPLFAEGLKNAKANAAPAGAPVQTVDAPALPAAVAPPAAGDNLKPETGAPAPAQAEGDDVGLMMKMALMDLAQQARAGKDPALYANVVYDRIPDDAIIVGLCTQADWWETLCNINGDIRPYLDWFTALRAELIRLAIEDQLLNADGTAAPNPPA
jgi:hypothetical protein